MTCCRKLDKRRRVESLARGLLERDPRNPALWVALGEATREAAHLWKAWELSNHKSASPMRALARLALERKNYKEVVRYFDEAVRINPVFGGDWFTLGYASLKLRLWARSGEAFTRVCQIDPEDAFAWNNLASIMLQENKPRLAFNAMSQALRNNRRDWRMWWNYFHIGTHLKEVFETTNTLNIILDIGKRHVILDNDVMKMFVSHTIAYLKGEIHGSGAAEAGNDGDAMQEDAVRFKSAGGGSLASMRSDIAHTPVVLEGRTHGEPTDDDDGDAGVGVDLAPLGMDSADVEAWDGGSAQRARDDDNAAAQAEIRRRHEKRVRDLFARLLENFVSDPDLYGCTARLFRYLDGPSAGYYYRVKELRACRQKHHWERDDKLFRRTVKSLEGMVDDALAMAGDPRDASPALGAQAPSTNPEPVESGNSINPSSAVADESCMGETASRPTGGEPSGTAETWASTRKSAMDTLEETLQNIRVVLSSTEEYMEFTEGFAHLRTLAVRVKNALQQMRPPGL
ncbi:unnamed protein product [Phytomonas sp. Hart1]|nr:unnamed protein product [Phytomonas sp. Hart1]|eukprot:CCW69682.1 unnamed protein product [Phytomonas sp. isolate Hart1]